MIKLVASEYVTRGHPDKCADQVSDALVDHFLNEDPDSHAAIEVLFASDGGVDITGEVKSRASAPDAKKIVLDTLRDIGYTDESYGGKLEDIPVNYRVMAQSPEIDQGVSRARVEDQGAGDQGIMHGYACTTSQLPEDRRLMPFVHMLARDLSDRLTAYRVSMGEKSFLRPDGKTQVVLPIDSGFVYPLQSITIAAQHDESISRKNLEAAIMEEVIKPTLRRYEDNYLLTLNPRIVINGTGRFVIGGPKGDTGLTGRKLAVDTYGGSAPHGGGAFSGKDPSKVDRSAAYFARYIAKNVVESGLANECLVSFAYTIGLATPDLFEISLRPERLPLDEVRRRIMEIFSIDGNPDNFGKPHSIINMLDLKRPIFYKTSSGHHFGFDGDDSRPWERVDKAEALKEYFAVELSRMK